MKALKLISSYKNTLIPGFLYLFIFSLFSFYSYKRLGAFGCFDDCFNYTAGYLISKGETIYSGFFFNHGFVMPFISSSIQNIAHPQSIYALVLYHKLFIFAFSFFMGTVLILRFRTTAALTLIVFESVKFFAFGDRFLGETLVIYPIFYLFFLVGEKLSKRKIYKWELILAAIFFYLIAMTREPYVLVSGFLYLIILFGKENIKIKIASIATLFSLLILTFVNISLNDFIRNVFTYNKSQAGSELKKSEILGAPFLLFFLYPLKIFFSATWGTLRQVEIVMAIIFIISSLLYFLKTSKLFFILIIIILGLSNIRPVEPGKSFYEAYHILVWLGLFIASSIYFTFENHKFSKKLFLSLNAGFLLIVLLVIFSPKSLLRERINFNEEFTTNYGNYYSAGQTIKILSNTNDTIFVDGYDELILWQADLKSSYKYSWYTSTMPLFDIYAKERINMLKNNPPDFYYGSCSKKSLDQTLDAKTKKMYRQIYFSQKPSCIYVLGTKIPEISRDMWGEALKLGYHLP